jgi:hypothetical protein
MGLSCCATRALTHEVAKSGVARPLEGDVGTRVGMQRVPGCHRNPTR